MFKQQQKIALKGQVYATPRTESVEVKNQGVLCASGVAKGSAKLTIGNIGNGSL